MRFRRPRQGRRNPRRVALGCFGCGCGAPLLAALIVAGVYTVNNRTPNIAIPTPASPPGNVYNDLVAASRMAGLIVNKAPASMYNPPTDRAGLLAATAACQKESAPALALMRSCFGKPFLLPPERSVARTGPSHAAFRELARTNSGVIQYYSLRGMWFEAARASLDGYEMAVMLPRGGALIALLVSRACEAIALVNFESFLPHLSEAELAAVAARLDRIAAQRVTAREIILEEGYANVAEYEEMLRNPKSAGMQGRYRAIADLAGVEADTRPNLQQAKAMARFALADKTRMLQDILDYHRRLADESTLPYRGATRIKPPDSLLGEYEMFGSIYQGTVLCSDDVGDLLRVETALCRFHKAHGRFPAALSELLPVYLTAVPPDPFDGGKPFRYSNRGGSFVLYSVGADMVDNGGTPAQSPAAQMQGDIVAGQIWRRRKQ